jgi:prepilin peptidase CpaA
MNYITLALVAIFPACMLWAAVSDIRTMTIPNRLTLFLVATYLPVAVIAGLSWPQIGFGLLAGVLGLVFGMILFALKLMGGGDAKLIAAASLWLGLSGLVPFLVYTAVLGGVLTIVLLVARHVVSLYALALPEPLAHLMKPRGDIPYGVAIALGGLMAIEHGPLAAQYIITSL